MLAFFGIVEAVGDFEGERHRNLYLPQHVCPSRVSFGLADREDRAKIAEKCRFLLD